MTLFNSLLSDLLSTHTTHLVILKFLKEASFPLTNYESARSVDHLAQPASAQPFALAREQTRRIQLRNKTPFNEA